MSFTITHRMGDMQANPGEEIFKPLLAELEENPNDTEHNCVAVAHETEWSLSVFRDGYLCFENLEEGEPRHMRGVSRLKVLALMSALSRGDLDVLEAEPWQQGYG